MATPSFLSDSQGERVDTIIDSAGSAYYKAAIGSNAAGGNGPIAAQLIGTHKPSVATAATDPFVAVLGTQFGAVGSNTYPVAVDTVGRVIVTGSPAATAIPISGTLTTTPPANASTNITQVGGAAVALGATTGSASVPVVLATDGVTIGALTETAPASDTASSGLNGRLQRIAQRLTSLIGLLPAALGGGGGLKTEGVGVAGTPTGGVVTVQGGDPLTGRSGGMAVTGGYSVGVDSLTTAGQYFVPSQAVNWLYTGGGIYVNARTPAVYKPISAVAITAGTPVAVWTPAAGKKFRVMGYAVSLTTAGSVIFKDATALMFPTPLMAAGIGQPSPPMGNGILSAVANNALNIDVTASGSVSGFVFGTEE